MKEQKNKIFREFLCGKWFPLLLLIVMACTYAVQLPQLGFYLDDWVSIAAYDQGGEAGLLAFGINDSRPFSAWVTAKFFAVLGTGVLQWQLITLFWRFAAAVTCFALLSAVWPDRKPTAGFISLLFGVFPYFRHQPICIAYFMILMQYFVILLSFLFTVKALQTQKRGLKILLFALSILTSIFHLSCLEYYLSLEAARLLLIFFVLSKRDGKSFKKTALRSLLIYIPYALIIVAILAYRFVYIPSLSADVRPVNLLTKYKGIKFFWHLLGLILQYLTESVFGVWYQSIKPSDLDLTMRNTQLGFGLGLLAAAIVFFLLRKVRGEQEKNRSLNEMIILGAFAMVLGYLPGMAIDASPTAYGNYQDRYLIPSFWGIAVFTVAWISDVFQNTLIRHILLSGMICIAVLFQIQNAYMYRYSWKYQQQFQWELKWRVPDIRENTTLISDGVTASFMGGWADSSMLLEMYGKKQGINPTPYWYFTVGDDNYLSVLGTDEPVYIKSKMYEFIGDAEDVLVITKPEYGKCAWVIDEADIDNPFLEEGVFRYIPYQNKSRIILDSDHVMPPAIFGSDYVHDWCYYFELGDLAFDRGNYDEAIRLFEESQEKGLWIGNVTEMRPFIKAAAFFEDWEKAVEWTKMANSRNPEITTDYFKNLWSLIDRDAPGSEEKSSAVAEIRQILSKKP